MTKFQDRKNWRDKTSENKRVREGDNNTHSSDWLSFANEETADDDFLVNREDVISDEGRFE